MSWFLFHLHSYACVNRDVSDDCSLTLLLCASVCAFVCVCVRGYVNVWKCMCSELVVQIVEACQAAGALKPGASDVLAVSVWSLVHGFASLLIEGQISHTVLDRLSVHDMLLFTLNQVTLVHLDPR